MRPIDLQFNYPLLGTEAGLATSWWKGVDAHAAADLLASRPGAGRLEHREAAAEFLRGNGLPVPRSRVFIAAGGHLALTLAIGMARLHGSGIAVDQTTYSNFLGLADAHSLRLISCAGDGDGMLPDALAAAARSGARAVYLMPTIHNPLGIVMPERRRRELAEVAERHGLVILEDDAYAFLEADPPPAFASLLPDRTFYVYSFSKGFAPLLKAAIFVAPPAFADAVEQAVILGSSSTSLFFAEMMRHLLETGEMERLLGAKRQDAVARQRMARSILGHCHISAHPNSYHLWIEPERISSTDLCRKAEERGVLLSDGRFFTPADAGPPPNAFRMALGAEPDMNRMRQGLQIVAELLAAEAGQAEPASAASNVRAAAMP